MFICSCIRYSLNTINTILKSKLQFKIILKSSKIRFHSIDQSYNENITMAGRRTVQKSGNIVIGMAPELKLPPYKIPKDLRPVLENNMEEFAGITDKQKTYLSALRDLINCEKLDANTYPQYLRLLLYMEEYGRELEMRMYDLKDQKIQRCGNGKEFLVHVPGLSEERPSLQLYDEVQLRKNDGGSVCHTSVTFIGQKYIRVESTPGFAKKYNEDHLYNVKFLPPRRPIQCCHFALDCMNDNGLVSAMFPEIKTCYNKLSTEPRWINRNIANNAEQKQAITNIIARTAHPAPYILFGPPGTGKTATLVEAISQIWGTSASNHVLICTPSNAAADEIVKRLLKYIPEQDIHRMYGKSRNWNDVDEIIQPCSNFIDEEIIFLPKDLIMLRRIVVVTLMSCSRLLALKLRENHFSYVFIDEAGQATEPETLIPLGLMSSADSTHRGRLQGQLVIAGDPMQLGPSVAVKSVNMLAKSMLERMMEQCEPYKKDDAGKYNPVYITKLIRNFRSNKFILHVPNKLFYDGELMVCGKDEEIHRALNCSSLPNKSFPLIFHAVVGEESRESHSPSVCNLNEIAVIMKYAERLIGAKLGGRKLEQKDIGIITPYKLQRIKIHQELERRNWNDVSVGTVEVFQGQERDVIIMSTVRSVIYKHNGKEHIGFLSNPKRFNVAVTRAKSLLITVGNPQILQFDNCWKELMNYCKSNKACAGASVSQKLTYSQKKNLYGKKYVPKAVDHKKFEFPIEQESTTLVKFSNCTLPEKLEPKRRGRMPKITKELLPIVAPVSQFEFDLSITSASNNSLTTDSEQQDRISNISSTDGHSSQSKNDCSPFTFDEFDEQLLSTSEATNVVNNYVSKDMVDYEKGIDSDAYKNGLQNSDDEFLNSNNDEDDVDSLLSDLDGMDLSDEKII